MITIRNEVPIVTTPRVLQVAAIFDVPPAQTSVVSIEADLPLHERPWHVGLIVGPSGAGKSSTARALFGDALCDGFDWSHDRAIVDDFPADLAIRDITGLFTSVGFGSAPAWLRPFRVLSTGEQFRATLARALAETYTTRDLVVFDEFTSVIDRQVAQVASHALQKTIRRMDRQFVAVSCHYDIIDWLQPDWVFQPHTGAFVWRSLQRHPPLPLAIHQVDRAAWRLFAPHHYLSSELHTGAKCFGAFLDNGDCVAFTSYIHFMHPRTDNIKMGHRLVVLPDYQGLGIAGRLDDWLGQYLYDRGLRYRNTVAHPAMIAYYSRSPRWRETDSDNSAHKRSRKGLHTGPQVNSSGVTRLTKLVKNNLNPRKLNTRGFEYTPPAPVVA